MEEETAVRVKATLILARIAGALSLFSIACTTQEAVLDWRKDDKRSSIITRLQAVLQLPLAILAVTSLTGTSMAPKDEGIWLASGNDATCAAQGFAVLLGGISGVLLDIFLSISFLLLIQYGWEEKRLQGVDSYFYLLVFPMGLLFGGIALGQDILGYTFGICFLAVPVYCEEDTIVEPIVNADDICTPSPPILINLRLFVFVLNMSHMLFSFYSMIQIYRSARKIAADVGDGSSSVTKLVALKGFLYASCIAVIQIPLALWVALALSGAPTVVLDPLNALATIITPMAGFFNMLVFLLGRRTMQSAYGKRVRRLIDVSAKYCCWCSCFVLKDAGTADTTAVVEE